MTTPTPIVPLRVYLADMSYFSGKLEAYLRYKGITYERIEATPANLLNEVFPQTGLMKVPVVQTTSGDWLKDTTPMLQWFEQAYPQGSINPPDPVLNLISLLIEDYADEWLWRPALYYRWKYKTDFRMLSRRIAAEVLRGFPGPLWLKAWYFGNRQWRLHAKGDGIRPHNEEHVRNTYLKLLDALSHIFAEQDYLLGNQPCAADFGLFGSMFRHFGLDPTPSKIMRDQAPAVYEWVARLWNARAARMPGTAQWMTAETLPQSPGWAYLLRELGDVYLPYLQTNARAIADNNKRFDLDIPGARYPSLKPNRYRLWCLNQLRGACRQLNEEDRKRADKLLHPYNIPQRLMQGEDIASGLEDEFVLPLPKRQIRTTGLKRLWFFFNGTPVDDYPRK